jgi:hypothetical protein
MKILDPTGTRTPTDPFDDQPVASPYTDYAIPAPMEANIQLKKLLVVTLKGFVAKTN